MPEVEQPRPPDAMDEAPFYGQLGWLLGAAGRGLRALGWDQDDLRQERAMPNGNLKLEVGYEGGHHETYLQWLATKPDRETYGEPQSLVISAGPIVIEWSAGKRDRVRIEVYGEDAKRLLSIVRLATQLEDQEQAENFAWAEYSPTDVFLTPAGPPALHARNLPLPPGEAHVAARPAPAVREPLRTWANSNQGVIALWSLVLAVVGIVVAILLAG